MQKITAKSKRVVVDFTEIDKKFKFTIGKVVNNTATNPLEEHCHEKQIEISYFVTGNQVYTVEGETYTLESGDVFVTYPKEYHGSGSYQKDKSKLYYLQLEEEVFNLLGVGKEGAALLRQFKQKCKRVLKVSRRVQELMECIVEEGQKPTRFSKTKVRNYMSELIIELIDNQPKKADEQDAQVMVSVIHYIDEHIEENISIKELAGLLQVSEGRFKILFKQNIGIPPKEYVLRQKIEVAKALLIQTDKSITQIAYKMGFASSQYFTTVFKRFNIYTPKEYRENGKNAPTVKLKCKL